MSRLRSNPEWRDSTADQAIENITNTGQKRLLSISEFRDVQPLSKFEDPSSHKGRRRLLRTLNRKLETVGKNNARERARIKDAIRELSNQQFTSRVTPQEARTFTGRRYY